jgi:hypothetical protein
LSFEKKSQSTNLEPIKSKKSKNSLIKLKNKTFYLCLSSRPFLDLFLVSRVAFDSQFDLLEAALSQNEFGDVAVLDVTEEPYDDEAFIIFLVKNTFFGTSVLHRTENLTFCLSSISN